MLPTWVITGVAGNGFTTTFTPKEVAEQPASPTVTVYVPDVVTVIDCVVAPVDHVFPIGSKDVNTTD